MKQNYKLGPNLDIYRSLFFKVIIIFILALNIYSIADKIYEINFIDFDIPILYNIIYICTGILYFIHLRISNLINPNISSLIKFLIYFSLIISGLLARG